MVGAVSSSASRRSGSIQAHLATSTAQELSTLNHTACEFSRGLTHLHWMFTHVHAALFPKRLWLGPPPLQHPAGQSNTQELSALKHPARECSRVNFHAVSRSITGFSRIVTRRCFQRDCGWGCLLLFRSGSIQARVQENSDTNHSPHKG